MEISSNSCSTNCHHHCVMQTSSLLMHKPLKSWLQKIKKSKRKIFIYNIYIKCSQWDNAIVINILITIALSHWLHFIYILYMNIFLLDFLIFWSQDFSGLCIKRLEVCMTQWWWQFVEHELLDISMLVVYVTTACSVIAIPITVL